MISRSFSAAVILALTTSTVLATETAMSQQDLVLDIAGTACAASVVWDPAASGPQPGILMIPNWMGLTPASLEKARRVAGLGYVVYVADVYGVEVRPTDAATARQAATTLRSDRPLMRQRVRAHLDHFATLAGGDATVPVDAERIAAIGFCFGGGCVLELARSGAPVPAVVSFHGNLDTPNPADAQQISASILILHGAIDPAVPAEQVAGFQAEMEAAQVDYQFVAFGGAVHSFTDPNANTPGRSLYDARSATRAFALMHAFLSERFRTR